MLQRYYRALRRRLRDSDWRAARTAAVFAARTAATSAADRHRHPPPTRPPTRPMAKKKNGCVLWIKKTV